MDETKKPYRKPYKTVSAEVWESRKLEMKRMYEDERMTYTQIGDYYGITCAGVRQWCQRFGIKSRKQSEELKAAFVEKWTPLRPEIERLHVVERLSLSEIARKYDVTYRTIGKVLRHFGIPIQEYLNIGAKNGRYKDGTQSRLYRNVIEKDMCSICSSTEKLLIHHIDLNHFNNSPDNLVVLCNKCHSYTHAKLEWAAKKSGKTLERQSPPTNWDNYKRPKTKRIRVRRDENGVPITNTPQAALL